MDRIGGDTVSNSSKRIANLLTEAARLSTRAAGLAQQGKVKEALRLEKQAEALRSQARNGPPVKPKRPDPSQADRKDDQKAGTEGTQSTRSLAIASLVELGVPASPRAVAEYTLARFGKTIDHRALASLRRDEMRAWASPKSARAVYLVPALEGTRFFPFRGKVALSNWAIARRLIGPWSDRVDHLVATKNLARQLEWLKNADPVVAEAVSRLVAAYASTVPGAVSSDEKVDAKLIQRAIDAELRAIMPQDEEWRAEAAEHAAKALNHEQQLWGLRAPTLVVESGS